MPNTKSNIANLDRDIIYRLGEFIIILNENGTLKISTDTRNLNIRPKSDNSILLITTK